VNCTSVLVQTDHDGRPAKRVARLGPGLILETLEDFRQSLPGGADEAIAQGGRDRRCR